MCSNAPAHAVLNLNFMAPSINAYKCMFEGSKGLMSA